MYFVVLITECDCGPATIVTGHVLRSRLVLTRKPRIGAFRHLWEVASGDVGDIIFREGWDAWRGDVVAVYSGVPHPPETRRQIDNVFAERLASFLLVVGLIAALHVR